MIGSLLGGLIGFLGTRAGRIAFFVLLAAGAYLLFRGLVRNTQLQDRPEVISLLESTRDLEQLVLVTGHTEHILLFGEPGRLEKIAETAIRDSVTGFQDLGKALAEANAAELQLSEALAAEKLDYAGLDSLTAQRNQALDQLNAIGGSFRQFRAELTGMSNAQIQARFGPGASDAWTNYQNARSRGRAHREAEQALESAYSTLRKTRSAAYSDAEKQLNGFNRNPNESRYRHRIERLTQLAGDARTRYRDALANQAGLRARALAADSAVTAAYRSSNPQNTQANPKLLAVIPAQVQCYLDLSQARFEKQSDSLVVVYLDSLHYSDVQLEIDSSRYFNTAGGGIGASRDLYGLIFQELQWGISEIREAALQQARSPMMRSRACAGARQYFVSLARPFGFRVQMQIAKGGCTGPVSPADSSSVAKGN